MGKAKKPAESNSVSQKPMPGPQKGVAEANRGLLLKILIFCSSAAIILATYSNTLSAPFLFDDLDNIKLNVFIRLDKLTLQGLWDAGFNSIASNRPVANISYALNYYFGRYDVAGYHVVNIGIHLLCTILLFFLSKTMFELRQGPGTTSWKPSNQSRQQRGEAEAGGPWGRELSTFR